VEDNPADVRLTQEVMKEAKVRNTITVAGDGVEAINLLRGDGTVAFRPDLILLDLNLPKKDGRELLADIKSDQDLKVIPVIILTTSTAEEDILKTYGLHANCYITKPVDLDQFIKVVKSVEDFWLTIVRLPNSERNE
jgi:chemotaxis family two-component system response regulator Rcp1